MNRRGFAAGGLAVAGLAVVALAGCTAAASTHSHRGTLIANEQPTYLSPTQLSSPSPSPSQSPVEHFTQPIAVPDCPYSQGPSPHFTTPEAAMRYLAAAWNRRDLASLCHVTNPYARNLLYDMHREAVNLRLDHCVRNYDGTYECYFDHDYPASMHKKGTGHATFDVAAAARPGWYMTVFEGCG